jgi:MFS family permease
LPLFAAYMIWGTGSGAQTLARPLFVFSLSDSVLLVTLLVSSLALSRMVAGPITGFLTDRWGRKPLAMAGAGIRGLASLGVLFVNSYEAFFVLEFTAPWASPCGRRPRPFSSPT